MPLQPLHIRGIFLFVLDLIAFQRCRLPQTPPGFGLPLGSTLCRHFFDPVGPARQELSASCPPVASSSVKLARAITYVIVTGDQAPNLREHAPLRLFAKVNSRSLGVHYTRSATSDPKKQL